MQTTSTPDLFDHNHEHELEVRKFAPSEPTTLGDFLDIERIALIGDRPPLDYALNISIRFMGIELVNKKTGAVIRDAYGNRPEQKTA